MTPATNNLTSAQFIAGNGNVLATAALAHPSGLTADIGAARQNSETTERMSSEIAQGGHLGSVVNGTIPPQQVKRGCITGTHPTYRSTPWKDLGVDIFSLNDAYVLPGFVRATSWVDLHPLPELVFRPKGERK